MDGDDPFDVEAFLARPLVARVAIAGPSIRPVWFLWEDGAFWWITGAYARLPAILAEDARLALVVDSCDLVTGEVHQVTAHGEGIVVPFDPERVRRKLVRYLGPDEATWDARFSGRYLADPDAATRLVRLAPERLTARDLSYSVCSNPARPACGVGHPIDDPAARRCPLGRMSHGGLLRELDQTGWAARRRGRQRHRAGGPGVQLVDLEPGDPLAIARRVH